MSDTGNIPESVRDELISAFDGARDAVRSGDTAAARDCLATASRLLDNDVPPGPVAEQLRHGIDAAERTAADEPVVASEYLRLVRRLLDTSADD
ncbi:hypothetical protein [Haloferax sp. DFSO52]|uniref:hypothetical protein n=1 Tax=Haloferax sp. DFSO52 TaxID=3388505 RepID=UPI003A89192E